MTPPMVPARPWLHIASVVLFASAGWSRAWAKEIKCSTLEAGGTIEVSGPDNHLSGSCDVALSKNLVLKGKTSDARIDLTPDPTHPFGVVFRLNSKKLTIQNLELSFDRGYAVDVLGAGSGEVNLSSVRVVDRMADTATCSHAADRFGIILHHVANASIQQLHIESASGKAATLQGGVLLVGEGAEPPVVWDGGSAKVRCGVAAEGVRRAIHFKDALVGNYGPCDMRPRGFHEVVKTGRP